jgi:hypothetical protein
MLAGPTGATPSMEFTLANSIFVSGGTGASANSSFSYSITLDAVHPYTYSPTGTGVSFNGPSGAVPSGSGTLTAGAYTLSSSLNFTTSSNGFSVNIMPVPEPGSLGAIGVAALLTLRRRRTGIAVTA